ncbi:MAG: hypothetical protein IJ850_11240 [Alistipes sp.]|uniref:Uncharacterized protein n=1 Tax=Alistipes intestinihominis TaxID=3133172 RepID=A0ABV1GT21_9BACT|nr:MULTISPECIES: hypothetical protein [Alistipes]MBR2218890.1 hypothetical protein [Alistipes sp.]
MKKIFILVVCAVMPSVNAFSQIAQLGDEVVSQKTGLEAALLLQDHGFLAMKPIYEVLDDNRIFCGRMCLLGNKNGVGVAAMFNITSYNERIAKLIVTYKREMETSDDLADELIRLGYRKVKTYQKKEGVVLSTNIEFINSPKSITATIIIPHNSISNNDAPPLQLSFTR